MLKLVGRYQVQERIGEGAMADVFRAYDPGINRVLAIKVLKAEYRQNRQYAARFLREAKAAGALSHPNIVTIYDVGEEDGYPYIAMELLEGQPLDRLLETRGALPPAEVAAMGAQLAEALRYAHGLGVIHRDIKPSNIMVSDDGRTVKILDFGIARLLDGDVHDAESLKTQVGQVLGTPRYMSPEQALGSPLDGRSDLFSIGVVLYEMITGRRAFDGASAVTLALQITQQEPAPISGLAPGTPRGLQFIVEKLLAKRPDKRFADGEQLAEALRREAVLAASLVAEPRSRRLPLQARLTAVMAAITAAALVLSVGAVLQRQDRAMQHMALTSGAAIASFVASNAALPAAENAGLAREQQDWAPVQAFIKAAASDPNVQQLTVVDGDGVVRASSDPAAVGGRYAPARTEPLVRRDAEMTITTAAHAKGEAFRFVRPITYAGRPFGLVDVSLRKDELVAATNMSRGLLGGLAIVTLGAVIAVSFTVAQALAQPIRRLRKALADAASGDLDFRISHNRRDEFGELFDGFNQLAQAVQQRLEPEAQAALPSPPAAPPRSARPQSGPFAAPSEADATRIADDLTLIAQPT